MTAQVTSFSFILVGNEPLLRDDPLRQWQFSTFRGEGTSAVPVSPLFTQVGGDLLDNTVHDYGAMLLPVRGDQTANGEVFSNATGKTYWVLAQAPFGSINNPDSQIGSLVRFEQAQSFTKLEEGATLELVITKTLLEAINFNPTEILPFDCVGKPACKLGMEARIDFRLIAYSAQAGDFNFNADSFVSLQNAASQIIGGAERWRLTLANRGSDAIWGLANFAFDPDKNDDGGTSAEVSLRQPITISIDLSEVDVLEEFSVRMTVLAKTFNQEQGESYVSAFFRDPVNAVGGTLEFTGLQPTNNPLPEPEDTSEPAPECTTGTDPEAGVTAIQRCSIRGARAAGHRAADPGHADRWQPRRSQRSRHYRRMARPLRGRITRRSPEPSLLAMATRRRARSRCRCYPIRHRATTGR